MTADVGATAYGNCHSRGNPERRGLRRVSLDGFPPLFEKASANNAAAFSQLPQARRRLSDRMKNRNRAADAAFTGVTYVPEDLLPMSPNKTLLQEGISHR